MAKTKPFCCISDSYCCALGSASNLQQELVLLRGEIHSTGSVFTELQKLPKLMSELGKHM
ncbi:MAG TPA: hypothetical protein VJ323_16720 [Bryobacteraceae bacterium]|nr:hypothetical protein [Bryobacteraceae bacterium]